jgi:signal transduction histidine kinase
VSDPAQRRRDAALEALDAATVAIASELSIDRVLQVIVDRVRPVVGARYAALGITDGQGRMLRFITSGIDEATRARIGPPPRGHGLLGVIVRERRSVRVPDLAADPRHFGFPPHHPQMHTFLGVPVIVEGESIGNLYLTDKEGGEEFTEADQRLVETFARHAGIAIANARLHEEIRGLSILQERTRIAQDLHDGIIQALYGVGLALEDVPEMMAQEPAAAAARVDRAIDAIHATIRDIRNFIAGLRPELLADVDLAGGLGNLVDELRETTGLEVLYEAPPEVDMDAEDAVQIVQLAREALSNVARHSRATRVAVEVGSDDERLRLVIADDGRGFEPAGARSSDHRGLSNMRERAAALGGTLRVESRPRAGTRVEFEMPLRAGSTRKETSKA